MKLKQYLEAIAVGNRLDVFDAKSADKIVKKLEREVKAPFVKAQKSVLGGPQNVSILLKLSLDPRETWPYKIFENSRYMHFHITLPNIIEIFNQSHLIKTKFRKARAKNVDDIIKKVNTYIGKANK